MPDIQTVTVPSFCLPKDGADMERSVDQHFSEAALEKRSPFEKYLLKTMKRNYRMTLGLPVTRTEFMKGPSARKRKLVKSQSDSESDGEWIPNLKSRKKELDMRSSPRYPLFSNSSGCVIVDMVEINNSRKGTTESEKITKSPDSAAPLSCYPNRNKTPPDDVNTDVPEDDNSLFCEECNKENDGHCPEHGVLEIIEDSEMLSEDSRKSADESSLVSANPPQGDQGIFAIEKIVDQSGETYFTCRRCPDVQFRCEKYLLSHMKYKHQVAVPLNWRDKYPNNLSPLTGTNYCGKRTNSRTVCNPGGMKKQQKGKTQSLLRRVNNLKGNNSNQRYSASNPFKCTRCDYRCNNKQQLNGHMRTHTGEKPFKCTLCDYRCSQKYYLDQHMRTHTGEKPFKCTLCVFRCSQKTSLDQHMRTHTGEKPFKCTVCEYRCSQKIHLDLHMRTHTGEKPFKCTVCEYRCSQKMNLDRHMRTHTGEKPFKCTVCDYRCSQKYYLDQHRRTHTGEKPFKCTLCVYRCSQKTSLDQHMRTHTGEKPFKCTLCDYRGSMKINLDQHMRTHTGEKPFKCTKCDYRCSRKHHLDRHMRTHTGEKPFKCTVCDYRCSVKSGLSRHIRTHTGEKPFKCTVCDYRCSVKSSLSRHIRTHTGEKPFKCTV